ncbi:hypothetical protein CEE37_08575 [candidate division LCP-89 bacterium B3_LCP]|uniref:Uncharacterized protein n=1 Tax=candidate division LCP-89 bacterium B3_LCP TaxID=2012998 RepID=A0A532UZQ1_UNCL8|nr:MAG: hypothetical protein CEE37_08575 [candidate division LCP-89 bacterium B3_LCP]
MSFLSEEEPRLPYPTKNVPFHGEDIEEYIIPENDKEEVLAQMYIFEPIPSLDEERLDIHSGKKFTIRDFLVTRERGRNWLVSPYYYEAGGTVIDWLPVEFGEE